MKKNIIKYLVLSIVFIGFLSSCKKDVITNDVSSITYYPEFTYNGDAVVAFEAGSVFVDPGISAEENGVEIPVSMEVSGIFRGYSGDAVQMDTPDRYEITYSAVNSDGYTGNQYRTVWIAKTGDLTTSLEGLYISNTVYGIPYSNLHYIIIWEVSPNVYAINDAVGGTYDLGRGYGPNYAAVGGTFTVNDMATNDFGYSDSVFPGFGNACSMSGLTVNAATKTLHYTAVGDWGGTFDVTLTQVTL